MGLATSLRLQLYHARAGSPTMTEQLLDEPIYFPTWPMPAAQGRKIIKREFTFCGHSIEMTGGINWMVRDASTDWHREFFSYKWLQDVAAIHSNKIASSFAREFINGFTLISKIDRVHDSAWETEVTGERLSHWLYYRHFVLKGGSHKFFSRYQRSLIKHVQFLYEHACDYPEHLGPNAIKGLIAAATIIPGMSFILHHALDWLSALLARDIGEDGIHISNSPNHHLAFCKSLIEIRDLLAFDRIAFDPLNDAIKRTGAMLAFLCHSDGRLGLFQDNIMDDADIIAHIIALSGATEDDTPIHANNAGYASLRGDGTHCIIRLIPADNAPTNGIASLECSDSHKRIIVNCGSYIGTDGNWTQALHQPSAFSTVALADATADNYNINSVRQSVTSAEHHDSAVCAYTINDRITHERNIEFLHDGTRIKGKDIISVTGNSDDDSVPVTIIRFHLHPDIRCQLHDGGGWLLRGVEGPQWVFTCTAHKDGHVEESVYLGHDGKPQKTLQIVFNVTSHESTATIRWELKQRSTG